MEYQGQITKVRMYGIALTPHIIKGLYDNRSTLLFEDGEKLGEVYVCANMAMGKSKILGSKYVSGGGINCS